MKMPALLANPRYLLPAIVFVSVLIMGIRIGDISDSITSEKMFSPTAPAIAESEAPKPSTAPVTDAPAAEAAKQEEPSASRLAPPADEDVSPAEIEVLKQLSDRRAQLDKRAKDLDTRESLIKVAETRVDQKIKEMSTLRLQLQSMVNQVSEGQNAQLENLVKIYETMKPEEAARIFETLDMPVLLGVFQRMKPARTAPIMAKMAPEKAKELTMALTKQDQLPQIK